MAHQAQPGARAASIYELDVLLYLRSHVRERVRIGALLDTVPLSQPALSRLVSRLEARGLLVRSEAEGDGRAVVVCLTEAGTALIDRALVIHARVVHETLVAKFSETERTALLRTLSQTGQWSVLMAFSPDANGDSSCIPTPGKYRARQPGEEPHCQRANVTQLACC